MYLVFGEFALDFVIVTHSEHYGFGELPLDTRQPRTQVAHVLVQLLHHHQSLLQLPHPETSIKSFIEKEEDLVCGCGTLQQLRVYG